MTELRVNSSDPREMANFSAFVRSLAGSGKLRVSIVKDRPRRSDRQNRWYWPCFVEPYANHMTETCGHTVTADDAHARLKRKFLSIPLANENGEQIFDEDGDPVIFVRSTTSLTTVEFNEYLDRVGMFLLRIGAIDELPEPELYREAV